MISQRDINAFFTVLDVLADPEKAKSELKVLSDMRASVDSDLQRVGEETQRAQHMLNEARNLSSNAALAEKKAEEHNETNRELAKALSAKDAQARKTAEQQQEINRLLNTREGELREREKALDEKLKRYETSLADHNVRNEALRKNEAEYRERMAKLKSIAN